MTRFLKYLLNSLGLFVCLKGFNLSSFPINMQNDSLKKKDHFWRFPFPGEAFAKQKEPIDVYP